MQVDGLASVPRAGHERLQPRHRGLGSERGLLGGVVVVEHPEQPAHLGERVALCEGQIDVTSEADTTVLTIRMPRVLDGVLS